VSYVDIKILVFNDDLVTLNIQRNTTAMEVYNLLAQVQSVILSFSVPYGRKRYYYRTVTGTGF
jgi:hypothetical protein